MMADKGKVGSYKGRQLGTRVALPVGMGVCGLAFPPGGIPHARGQDPTIGQDFVQLAAFIDSPI